MASSKDIQLGSRSSLHRPGLPHSRAGSHSLIGSSPSHRVTRRKSLSSSAASRAAIAAALDEGANLACPLRNAVSIPSTGLLPSSSHRLPGTAGIAAIPGDLPSMLLGLAGEKCGIDMEMERSEIGEAGEAVEIEVEVASPASPEIKMDNHAPNLMMSSGDDPQPPLLPGSAKERGGRKGVRAELRCDQCGKGYKHSSCLAKHLWEHTPGWSYTSRLLISKHQQVQLLEAASVLVAMNNNSRRDDVMTPPDSARDSVSDPESVSPTASSGYSDQRDRSSSAEITPPPGPEGFGVSSMSVPKRSSSSENGFPTRPYQSVPSPGPLYPGTVPSSATDYGHHHHHHHHHHRHPQQDSNGHRRHHHHHHLLLQRPDSSGRNCTGPEDRDLAAAVKLLSCSFGSNGGSSRTETAPLQVPPLPPLPAQYLDGATQSWAGIGFFASLPSRQPESFTRGERGCPRDDQIQMAESESGMDDEDEDDGRSRARSEEDDDGVFGRMEE